MDTSSTWGQLKISNEYQYEHMIEESSQELSAKPHLHAQKQTSMKEESFIQDVYPSLISAYDWACTGGRGVCRICSAGSPLVSVGRKPSQKETQKLQGAIKSGDIITIESMIKQDFINVNATLIPLLPYRVPKWSWKYCLGYTPLHCAVEEGKLSAVQILVQLGADVMATATKLIGGTATPPERAVDKNLIDIVYFFVTKCKLDVAKFNDTYQISMHTMVKQYEEAHPKANVKAHQHGLVISHHTVGKGKWGLINKATFRDQQVAAKFYDESIMPSASKENLMREINILAHCNHKNLVSFLGVVLNHPTIVVFELMDCSLQFALSNGQTSVDHFHPICLDVANGLYYLHNIKPNALIHHNLCSSNILLKADGQNWIAKLSDLSLAQFTSTIAAQNTKAISHSTYTAPEISKHNSHRLQTAKVDIFSYGIVFIEVLLQRLPSTAIPEMVTALHPHWPDHVAFLTLCTSDNPDERPNISEVINTVSKLHHKI